MTILDRDAAAIAPVRNAAHLCVDMQRLFATGGVWETPWMPRVLPAVLEVTARYAERTIFTRFVPPETPEHRPGQWQAYFRHWQQATRRHLPPEQIELVPELARFAPPGIVVDKPAYSGFMQSGLLQILTDKGIDTVVVTGAETDICVLATVLSAVDLGFRTLIVEDALCSSSDTGHDALMTLYRSRLRHQIEMVNAEQLFELWAPA